MPTESLGSIERLPRLFHFGLLGASQSAPRAVTDVPVRHRTRMTDTQITASPRHSTLTFEVDQCRSARKTELAWSRRDHAGLQRFVELARICLKQAREATIPSVRDELNRMARQYQQRAAKLDGRELVDIGKVAASVGGLDDRDR